MGIKTKKVVSDKNISIVLIWEQEDIAWLFIKFLINETRYSYHNFLVPEPIFQTTEANKKGFSDSS